MKTKNRSRPRKGLTRLGFGRRLVYPPTISRAGSDSACPGVQRPTKQSEKINNLKPPSPPPPLLFLLTCACGRQGMLQKQGAGRPCAPCAGRDPKRLPTKCRKPHDARISRRSPPNEESHCPSPMPGAAQLPCKAPSVAATGWRRTPACASRASMRRCSSPVVELQAGTLEPPSRPTVFAVSPAEPIELEPDGRGRIGTHVRRPGVVVALAWGAWVVSPGLVGCGPRPHRCRWTATR